MATGGTFVIVLAAAEAACGVAITLMIQQPLGR